ncbi:MAG: SMC family ATPase [Proteocatella sp.]
MKLQKLIISGFGPYAESQTLDFETNLQDKSMFVISGNTGAGKTTIFDAINFALYGSANGSEREGKSLRSDFAKPGTDTQVELWFSLRNKNYYVKRSPQYERPKQRGEGTTRKSAAAELKDIILEKTITGYGEVTNEVEKILGINSSQFKQLVMIPQGEFKKLLNADSKDKESIFRKIFGTEAFEQIQKQIVENANVLKKELDTQYLYKKSAIRKFKHDCEDIILNEALIQESPNYALIAQKFDELSQKDLNCRDNLDESLVKVKSISANITKELLQGEATNLKFKDFEEKTFLLSKLSALNGEFDQKKDNLNSAKKALEIKPYEDRHLEKSKLFTVKQDELKALDFRIENLSVLSAESQAEFENQKAREDERTALQKDLDKIGTLKEKTAQYEERKKSIENLELEIRELKKRTEKIKEAVKSNDMAALNSQAELDKINILISETAKLDIECNNYRTIASKTIPLIKSIKEYSANLHEHGKTALEYEALDKKYAHLKDIYDSLDDTFRRNQAGLLARDLAPETACPVCGSLEHPLPAILENAEISEAAVKKSRVTLEETQKIREKAYQRLTAMNEGLKALKNNSIMPALEELLGISDFEDIGVTLEAANEYNDSIIRRGKDLKSRIIRNTEIINQEQNIKEAKKLAENQNVKLDEEKEGLVKTTGEKEVTLSALSENLKAIELDFNGEIRTLSQLEAQEKTSASALKLLREAFIKSEENFSKTKEILDIESGQHAAKKSELINLASENASAKDAFNLKLSEIGFIDEYDYRNNLIDKSEIEKLEASIKKFSEDLRDAEVACNQARKNVEGLAVTDLDAIKQRASDNNIHQLSLENQSKEIYSQIQNNKGVVAEFKKIENTIEKLEKKFNVIGDLAKIIRGDNSSKMSFERYVLASYYEDIIDAANLRFNKMSSGRFELSRKQEVGDARKGSGLDLEVFDNYTGKSRDVKTLSGGESFKASLSMALGLADVVQSYAGGIQLDTMFIDEGFGTLDPESLDKAIECLIDLQNDGRLVGIISHVPELKERIGTKLEVSMTNNGSKAEFILN